MLNGRPKLRVRRSPDGGESFAKPRASYAAA